MKKRALVYFTAAVAFMIAIFVSSSLPQEALERTTRLPGDASGFWLYISSQTKHVSAYFMLSLLLFFWLRNTKIGLSSLFPVVILAIVISSVYGITDELHQAFVPTRYATISDVINNLFGSTLVVPVAIGLQMLKRGKANLKLLFVCTGNASRSPTAEEMYMGKRDIDVMSAGTSNSAPRKIK